MPGDRSALELLADPAVRRDLAGDAPAPADVRRRGDRLRRVRRGGRTSAAAGTVALLVGAGVVVPGLVAGGDDTVVATPGPVHRLPQAPETEPFPEGALLPAAALGPGWRTGDAADFDAPACLEGLAAGAAQTYADETGGVAEQAVGSGAPPEDLEVVLACQAEGAAVADESDAELTTGDPSEVARVLVGSTDDEARPVVVVLAERRDRWSLLALQGGPGAEVRGEELAGVVQDALRFALTAGVPRDEPLAGLRT